ncbi:MAG: hypothetical protein JO023_12070 [Chloroflexi bacterium]|nr:hypothetical protein [Chloroflexota bacterium]
MTSATAARASHGIGRPVLVTVLVVLSCLGLLLTVLALWVHVSFLNTDHWVETVGPLAQNPEVVDTVSAYLADQAVNALDLQQRVDGVLPGQLQFLGQVLTSASRDFVQGRIEDALQTSAFQNAWVAFNRTAHAQALEALRGQSSTVLISNDSLQIDAQPLILAGLSWIEQQAPGLAQLSSPLSAPVGNEDPAAERQLLSQAVGRALPADFGQVVVLQSPALGTATRVVSILDALVWVLPVVTLVAIAASVVLTTDRRRIVIGLGAGVAVTFLIARVVIARLEDGVVDAVTNPSARAAAAAIVQAVTGDLAAVCSLMAIVGLAVAAVGLISRARARSAPAPAGAG